MLKLGAVTVEDLNTLASVLSEDDLDKVKAQADKLIDAIETFEKEEVSLQDC